MRHLFVFFVLGALGASIAAVWIGSWEMFGALGSAASVIGLILTVYVTFAVAEIRKRYIRQALLRASLDRFEGHCRTLATALRKKDADKLRDTFSRCIGVIDELSRYFQDVESVELTGRRLRSVCSGRSDESLLTEAPALISRIAGLTEQLQVRVVQLEWGERNV